MSTLPPDLPIDKLPFEIRRNLEASLSRNNSWEHIVQYLISLTVELDLNYLRSIDRPVYKLFEELAIRNCNFQGLCTILENCKLYHALSYLRPPEQIRIIQQPGNDEETLYINFDEKLELKCEARSLPPPVYQWYRDNTRIDNATNDSLIIENFMPEDVGTFYCKVKADDGNPNSLTVISNKCFIDITPIIPLIEEQPEGIIRQEGETIFLKCIADGYPEPNYQWYKDNQLLEKQTRFKLYINVSTIENSGNYKCLVSNTAGEVFSHEVLVKIRTHSFPSEITGARYTAKEKVALLVGNANYKYHDRLVKPIDDVIILAEKLQQIGFKVIALVNLNLVEMKNVIRQFSNLLSEEVYGLFYFGGHGIQITETEERFMLPVDTPNTFDVNHCISENETKNMMLANNPLLRIVILDMCLKPPESALRRRGNLSSDNVVTRPDVNFISAYSTSGNLSAYERKSDPNGTYIKHLSRFITRNMTIPQVFHHTHRIIYQESSKMEDVSEQQIPMLFFNVYKDLCFTDKTSGDDIVETCFQEIFLPPNEVAIKFEPEIQFDMKPVPIFYRYKNCILNILEIELKGIDPKVWKLTEQSGNEAIKIDSTKQYYHIIVEGIQRPEFTDVCLNLKIQSLKCDITSEGKMSVYEPLIATWYLFYQNE